MTRYAIRYTDAAKDDLLRVEGAERIARIPEGALDPEAIDLLLEGTALGGVLTDIDALAVEPYGGLSVARTAGVEWDRSLISGAYAIVYTFSGPPVDPPVVTITGIQPPRPGT